MLHPRAAGNADKPGRDPPRELARRTVAVRVYPPHAVGPAPPDLGKLPAKSPGCLARHGARNRVVTDLVAHIPRVHPVHKLERDAPRVSPGRLASGRVRVMVPDSGA